MLELRGLLELGILPLSLPMLATAPRGDGHPVLLLPGFMGSERLADRPGAVPAQPRLRGADLGPGAQRRLSPRPRHRRSSRRSATCTTRRAQGQPGGLEPGRRVRAVRRPPGPANACAASSRWAARSRSIPRAAPSPPLLKALYRLIAHPMGPAAHTMQPRAKTLRERKPLPMPVSCLYSLSDGVVPPQEATHRRRPGAARERPRAAAATSAWASTPLVL